MLYGNDVDIKSLLCNADKWSYAHRMGDGELSEKEMQKNINRCFWRLLDIPNTQYIDQMNSDINWRDISNDHSIFLPQNQERRIIVHTFNDLIWDSYAKYVDRDYVLKDCQYHVVKYAYMN